jgi:hypothetical protein
MRESRSDMFAPEIFVALLIVVDEALAGAIILRIQGGRGKNHLRLPVSFD